MELDSVLAQRAVPSPNKRARRAGERIEFAVLHGTWMAGDEGALSRLTDPLAEVSCHYYVTRAGEIIQLVPEAEAAFHAGKSQAVNSEGVMVEGLNNWSIGIELANSGPFGGRVPTVEEEACPDWSNCEPYTLAQYDAVIALLRDLMARYPLIVQERVVGHDAVAPGRKSDPGPHFDWDYLEAAGVAKAPRQD